MKTVKGLLLGSAAVFVAMSGAQAADLPMAAPVQYVKVCDTYGAGFFYIPGTQTCLQISGFAKAQFRYDRQITRAANVWDFRAQAGVNFEAFESRFQTTCCKRSASPAMIFNPG